MFRMGANSTGHDLQRLEGDTNGIGYEIGIRISEVMQKNDATKTNKNTEKASIYQHFRCLSGQNKKWSIGDSNP